MIELSNKEVFDILIKIREHCQGSECIYCPFSNTEYGLCLFLAKKYPCAWEISNNPEDFEIC